MPKWLDLNEVDDDEILLFPDGCALAGEAKSEFMLQDLDIIHKSIVFHEMKQGHS